MASLLDGFIDAVSGAEAGLVALCVVMPLENCAPPFRPAPPTRAAPLLPGGRAPTLSLGWAGAQ